MGKVWEDKGSLQGGPKRTGGALLRREAAGSLGPGHKMAAAPLGLLVQDRGAAVRCSRPGRRMQPRRSQLQEGQAEKGTLLSEAKAEGSARARRAAARAESLRAKGKAGVADCPGVGGQAAEPAEAAGPRAGPRRGGGDGGGGARAAGKLGGRRAGARTRAHAGRAARSRGRWGCLPQLRSRALATPRLRRERPVGPHPVRGVRGWAAAAASFWCLGRPEEPGRGTAD